MTVGELVTLLKDLEDQNMIVNIPSEYDMSGVTELLFVDVVGESFVLLWER